MWWRVSLRWRVANVCLTGSLAEMWSLRIDVDIVTVEITASTSSKNNGCRSTDRDRFISSCPFFPRASFCRPDFLCFAMSVSCCKFGPFENRARGAEGTSWTLAAGAMGSNHLFLRETARAHSLTTRITFFAMLNSGIGQPRRQQCSFLNWPDPRPVPMRRRDHSF